MTPARLAAALIAAGHWCPGGMFADEAGVEFLTGAKPRTLRDWRSKGKGPPATQLARVAYDLQDLAKWMTSAKSNRQGAASSGRKRQIAASSDIDTTVVAD